MKIKNINIYFCEGLKNTHTLVIRNLHYWQIQCVLLFGSNRNHYFTDIQYVTDIKVWNVRDNKSQWYLMWAICLKAACHRGLLEVSTWIRTLGTDGFYHIPNFCFEVSNFYNLLVSSVHFHNGVNYKHTFMQARSTENITKCFVAHYLVALLSKIISWGHISQLENTSNALDEKDCVRPSTTAPGSPVWFVSIRIFRETL